MQSRTYRANEPSVIADAVEGETIVLNFDNGHYYSFNAAASEIWNRLCGGATVGSATEAVAQRFSVDVASIERAVHEFVQQLEAEHLLRAEARDDAASFEPPAPAPGGAFSPPAFEKFTDMEQLLLLDPIHDVSDKGWPYEPGGR